MVKRPNRIDVARRAGVSSATVSYVINNGPRPVSDETRLRVEAAIKELGYRPHAVAQSLRKGNTHTVGLLVQSLVQSFVSTLINSVEESLAERGYGLILASTHEDPIREASMLNTLASQAIDGLLYVPTSSEHSGLVQRMLEEGMPLVFVDRYIRGVPADVVTTDNIKAAREMTEYLLRQGCRRIMIISFSDEASSAVDRVTGYQQALLENGLPLNEELVLVVHYNEVDCCEEILGKHIQKYGLPDGILCTTDGFLVKVTKTLTRMGFQVPEQVQVAGGFSESPWNDLLESPFPIVRQNYDQIAAHAVQFLLERIEGSEEPARMKLIDPQYSYVGEELTG